MKDEKETARFVEKLVDFSSGHRAIPYRFLFTAVFSQ
jgi:hypothetical protein